MLSVFFAKSKKKIEWNLKPSFNFLSAEILPLKILILLKIIL